MENLAKAMDRLTEISNLKNSGNQDALLQERAFDFSYLTKEFLPNWKSKAITSHKFMAWDCTAGNGLNSVVVSSLLFKENISAKVLATGSDTKHAERIKNGVYKITEVERINLTIENSYLKGQGEVTGWVKFKDEVLQCINGKQHELSSSSYLAEELFDLVLAKDLCEQCIEPEVSEHNLDKIYRSLKANGLLMVESAASIPLFAEYFYTIAPGCYQKIRKN